MCLYRRTHLLQNSHLLQASCMLLRQRGLNALGSRHVMGSCRLVRDGGGLGGEHLSCSHRLRIAPVTLGPAAGNQPP